MACSCVSLTYPFPLLNIDKFSIPAPRVSVQWYRAVALKSLVVTMPGCGRYRYYSLRLIFYPSTGGSTCYHTGLSSSSRHLTYDSSYGACREMRGISSPHVPEIFVAIILYSIFLQIVYPSINLHPYLLHEFCVGY